MTGPERLVGYSWLLFPFMSTVPYLARIVFIILFQQCEIFAFCWHEPTKKVLLYTKKRLFNIFPPTTHPFFFF